MGKNGAQRCLILKNWCLACGESHECFLMEVIPKEPVHDLCGKKYFHKYLPEHFSGNFREILAQIFRTPTNLPALTPIYKGSEFPGTSPPSAVYCRSLAAYCLGLLERHSSSLFSADFHSCLVSCCCEPIECMLKALFRDSKQYQIVRKRETVDISAHNYDTRVVTAVTVYPIHTDYEEEWQQRNTLIGIQHPR